MSALIVLGNRLRRCLPSHEMKGRIETAIEFSKLVHPDFLVLTGGQTSHGCTHSESEEMSRLLPNHDDFSFEVLLERQSMNTLENAIYARKLLSERDYGGALYIVTSCYHISRAIFIFSSVFPQVKVKAGMCYQYNAHNLLKEADKLKDNISSIEKIEWDRSDYLEQYLALP